MTVIDNTLQNLVWASWLWLRSAEPISPAPPSPQLLRKPRFDVFAPARHWLDNLDVRSRDRARWLCRTIPAQCPFEREISLFGKTLFRIPPLCELNPVYHELVYLRFRALSYLADDCGEDVTPYI